jgi:hypothetical protein
LRYREVLVKLTVAILLLAALLAAALPSSAEPFEGYGRLEKSGECIGFTPWIACWNPCLTDLDAVPDSIGDAIVLVRGDLSDAWEVCGQNSYYSRLAGAEVVALFEPIDLGCGVLAGFPEEEHQGCLLWVSPVYGHLLADYRGYAPGDTVGVVGIYDPCIVTFCMNHDAVLLDWSYYPCSEPPAVQSETWGALKRRFLQ